jgi:hypothetical protein
MIMYHIISSMCITYQSINIINRLYRIDLDRKLIMVEIGRFSLINI